MQVCKQSGCKRRRARVSAARRAAHLHSALLLPSSAARPPRWQRQLVWDVRHAASCATSSIFSRSAICYLFPRCSRRGYRFKHTYVTDAGVADWRHDMENRAYRRDRLRRGSLKTWGACPWSDSQLRPRRGPTALSYLNFSFHFPENTEARAAARYDFRHRARGSARNKDTHAHVSGIQVSTE